MESLPWALRTLGGLLLREHQHLKKARKEMVWLEGQMQKMQEFILVAEQRKQFADESFGDRVKEFRRAASFAELIVAKYVLKHHQGYIKDLVSNPISLHNISNEITKFKGMLKEIQDDEGRYRWYLPPIDNPQINQTIEEFRRNARYIKREEVIGFEEHIQNLSTQLCEGEPRLYVVGVVGMGGVGKTVLASQVFQSSDVHELFPIRVWVYLSQNYIQRHGGIQSLLLQIAKELKLHKTEDLNSMSTDELWEHVKRSLKGKRYLIVMDDTWEAEVWDLIKEHLPDESNKSRIMITTRNENVARRPALHSSPYRLRCLDKEQSRDLVTKSVFKNEDGVLQKKAEELLEKCGGSPLALDCLVKCLRGKKARNSTLEDEQWQEDWKRCMDTLKLSYTCLPIHLKWCFLHLSAFPEDSKIEVERITKLWVAEGFVSTEKKTWEESTSSSLEDINNAEDIALSYLEQLKARCLVEFPEETGEQFVNGRVKYCSIHNLHRLLIKAEAVALDFMDFCDKPRINYNAHRLAVRPEASSLVTKLDLVPARFSLRTLLDFRSGKSSIRFKSFSVLKVLDLEGSKIDHVPKQIGKLICLRYLSIKNTPCRKLPQTIVKLPSLEILDCRVEGEFSMPKKIWKITTLTHVYGKKLRCDWRVRCADKLKTLESVFLCHQIEESINRCKQLRVLHIHIPNPNGRDQINNSFWTDLQDLPALESLYFDLSRYKFMNMTCREGKFPKLQSLTLENFEGEEWEVKEGSMASLKTLNLQNCKNLKNLQYGLRGCSDLQEINCSGMGQTFQAWYQNHGAVDFPYVTWDFSSPI